MMIQKILASSLIVFSSLVAFQVSAGNLYRYINDEGVKALSTSLPPHAAKRGYEILDGNTMRVLETIAPELTAEQIAEIEKKEAEEKEQQRLAEIAAKEQAENDRKQAIHDQTLLATYPSINDFHASKERDLKLKQDQLDKLKQEQPKLESDLTKFQQQAAEQELAGSAIDENLSRRIKATKQDINNHHSSINVLEKELTSLEKQYEIDEKRLVELLAKQKP